MKIGASYTVHFRCEATVHCGIYRAEIPSWANLVRVVVRGSRVYAEAIRDEKSKLIRMRRVAK